MDWPTGCDRSDLAGRSLSSVGETFDEPRHTQRAMVEKNAVATPDPHFDRIVTSG